MNTSPAIPASIPRQPIVPPGAFDSPEGANQRLGINTKLAGRNAELGFKAAPEVQEQVKKRNARDRFVVQKYRLRTVSGELLPDYRVASCGKIPIPDKEITVWKGSESGHAHWKGLGVCGSVWTCPVCATKIAIGKREQVQLALERGAMRGWKAYMVTLTASHTRGDSLATLLRRTKTAKKRMKNWRGWRALMTAIGLRGYVDATEITWYFTAGWHVHFHIVLLVEESVPISELESKIYALWSKALDKQGMYCSPEHGVQVSVGDDKAAQYVTKWSLEQEITTRDKPGREGHYSPFQLLALYEDGELWAGNLFQEYADATKGRTSVRFSRGLLSKLDIPKVTDQELAETTDQEKGVHLVTLTGEQFKQLLYSGRKGVLGEVLVVAERGRAALLVWLAKVFGIVIPPLKHPPGRVRKHQKHKKSSHR